MLPLRDENPHPPGFKPTVTYALIIVNVIVFLFEIAVTGQFLEFTNNNAYNLFYNWGAVPNCVTGATVSTINFGQGPINIPCPSEPYFSLLSSTFLHGGLMHLGGNMLFLWIFGDNIELKFGKIKYLGIYLFWGISAGLIHILGDTSSAIPAVGASGAISGVLGAYLVIFPKAKIQTVMIMGFFMRMMHIQAKWFLPFWLIFQNLLPFFIGGFGIAGDGVAYLAHIGGFIVGLGTGYLYRKTHSSDFTYGTRYGYNAYK
ncbi:rhomboid family intramembrane serine protease [Candidatus Nitrosarchaeum limnium]|jgi:membrane associated rhomboid family serine protease|uniref:Peptidase, S54 family n=1 Tax=Candidatus Nitrosarchaeum limnium BG20 TaxID=859192 RepID=S2E7U7_9ARCH|nr:rhomboid family intramembrane serine protease [Candidatus Nitrosarchaeum limnium]EPA06803.1 peptidase, S54 family [Candidatus Nitrosarchaeum limnium BG20]